MSDEKRIKTMDDILEYILPETVSPEQRAHFENMMKRIQPEDQEQLEWFIITMSEQMEKLNRQALMDPLTEVYNRRKFDIDVILYGSKATRLGYPMSLVYVDIDHLKDINDGHKRHEKGDVALRNMAGCMKEILRDYDMMSAYRIGGDEFGLILDGAGIKGAEIAGERIREGFEKTGATLSAGLSSFSQPSTSIDSLKNDADGALYDAKKKRNMVVVYGNGRAA